MSNKYLSTGNSDELGLYEIRRTGALDERLAETSDVKS
jgi:hypothetical protein